MESNHKDSTILIFIASILFLVIALTTYIYFETNSALKIKAMKEMADPQHSASPPEDIYPLYSGLQWSDASSVVTQLDDLKFHTFEIASKPIAHATDVTKLISPFKEYYEKKLTSQGWEVGKAKTQGPASSQWTYKKDRKYIILSYVYEQEKPYRGGPIKCPCTVNFNIVTGGNE